MASRYSAARPKREGENFARTHHHQHNDVKFDVRNPSTLAPDAREDDAILDADVIGASGATKRGAVNLDGYDSDSENENFNARAENRKRGKVDIIEQLDNYTATNPDPTGPGAAAGDNDDDDDDDMFAADDANGENEIPEEGDFDKKGRKKDRVRFLDADQIDGVDNTSRDKGGIRLDDESSDDEADVELARQEEGVDEEVGLGGLKKNAPKVEAFNLKQEMEEGQFDQEGNYVRKGGDPDAVHDNWLEGLSKKEMKKAAAAHEKREAEARKQRLEDDEVLVSELLKTLILNLERAETPLEALARLGKKQTKPKKIPKWKLKKMNKDAEGMEVDGGENSESVEQKRIKASIDAITEAADKLLSRDHEEIYEQERELLVREYRKETGEDWVEPEVTNQDEQAAVKPGEIMWEFRWADGRDGNASQGPYDGATMKAWKDAGYFPEGAVEFRAVGGRDWSLHVDSFE
ncbi:LIN1-like protein [Fusarium austroafricanum]|uniref:LIN1-like protein n=1 Tax=Fusarium austroafricanum TaxID=2364996 RepID=A0A8H4NKW2_9HYPO|nr:LIN1-like protein [Fusarium austroafricanum]